MCRLTHIHNGTPSRTWTLTLRLSHNWLLTHTHRVVIIWPFPMLHDVPGWWLGRPGLSDCSTPGTWLFDCWSHSSCSAQVPSQPPPFTQNRVPHPGKEKLSLMSVLHWSGPDMARWVYWPATWSHATTHFYPLPNHCDPSLFLLLLPLLRTLN